MAIKVLKASSYYPGYLRWFYRRNPNLTEASYTEQFDALMQDCFSCSDLWKQTLEKSGRFQVEEVVINAEPLQKRWAAEQGVKYRPEEWRRDILRAQFERFDPDVLYAHAQEVGREKSALRRLRKRRLVVVCYEGAGLFDARLAEDCDLMLTCAEPSVPQYEACGAKTHLMSWGFDDRALSRVKRPDCAPTVSFIGSIGSAGHHHRAFLLAELARSVPLNCWISNQPRGKDWGKIAMWYFLNRKWEWLRHLPRFMATNQKLRRLNAGELYGIEMLSALAASKMTLNVHIDGAGDKAANIRLFESTGMGSCLVTDWKSNLKNFFEPDYEVVTFRSAEEAGEKIKYLMNHEAEREKIARRGQQRTLRDHLYRDRVTEVGELIAGLI